MPELTREDWYRRRVKALEDLLASYRTGARPSERLHAELARTREHIAPDGSWRGEPNAG